MIESCDSTRNVEKRQPSIQCDSVPVLHTCRCAIPFASSPHDYTLMEVKSFTFQPHGTVHCVYLFTCRMFKSICLLAMQTYATYSSYKKSNIRRMRLFFLYEQKIECFSILISRFNLKSYHSSSAGTQHSRVFHHFFKFIHIYTNVFHVSHVSCKQFLFFGWFLTNLQLSSINLICL